MVSAEDSAVRELVCETDEAMLSAIQRQTLAARFSSDLAEGGDVAMENVRRRQTIGLRDALLDSLALPQLLDQGTEYTV